MPPRRAQAQENRLIFVGGPALTERTGPVRSKLLQQAHRQKKSQQRQNAAFERELLTRGERSDICTCNEKPLIPPSQAPGIPEDTRYRPIMPKMSALIGTTPCSVCGKSLASSSQVVPWDIGAGAFDPMIPIDETTSQLKIQEILYFACTSIWPYFRPLTYTSKCYQSWVFPCDNKVRLYAVLWAASYHRDVLNVTYGGPTYQAGSKDQLTLKGLTLKALREEVTTYTGETPIDSIIMCILYLAVNETVDARICRDPSPFNPPFTYLHALDIYGSRDYHPIHWSIIQDLLARYGGVEALQDSALAWLLSLSDIMGAANTLQKPIYPCLSIYGKRMSLEPPLILFKPYASHFALENAGSGFDELLSLDPPVQQGIVDTFSQVGQLSCILQYYTITSLSPEVLDVLGDCRNYVHHGLFSSPDTNSPTEEILQHCDRGPEAKELSREIYLTCRLAVFLYATHVTFPLPRSAVLRSQLLQQLCPKVDLLAGRNAPRRLLLWCVSVVLVASDLKSDETILDLFKRLCYELEVEGLDDLLVLLREFAWVDKAVEHQYERLSVIMTKNK
ncbi:hypothetical protein F53441_5996 [Fusarium austroafricanum]|uniref:Uncharacterized protein n=1 Tax=Fusarium austroafricanum TaxID=2364996 RepID=A0A8H4KIV0_9HYPO|nr:hypothetical protein F53441_5996 [Fusarium austroafricanum]